MRQSRSKINRSIYKRKSPVWKYFDNFEDGVQVYCLLCAANNKQSLKNNADGNTSGLWHHMKTKHMCEWEEIKDDMRKVSDKYRSLGILKNKGH